jgi:uncharacterized protein
VNDPLVDRLSVRSRPPGRPLMYQSWGSLLFLHWRLPVDLVRRYVPAPLEVDTFDGSAWIGVVPFTMWGIRPLFLPALPGLSSAHELNVRTYVHYRGVPGVWFLSLDVTKRLAVWGARTFFYLPYFHAKIRLDADHQSVDFVHQRRQRGAPEARFEARWTAGELLPEATPDSLDYFLTERYCLYSVYRDRLYRARINHQPWPLRRASLEHLRPTMLSSHSLPEPADDPVVHHGDPVRVGIWPLERVSGGA